MSDPSATPDMKARYEIQTRELQRERAVGKAMLRETAYWRAEAIELRRLLGMNPTTQPIADAPPEPLRWLWGHGEDAEVYYGGYETREEAIDDAFNGGEPGTEYAIVHARPQELRFDAYPAASILEMLCDHNEEAWGEDGPISSHTRPMETELEAAVAATVQAWNLRHRAYRAWMLDIVTSDLVVMPGGSEAAS